MDQAVLGKMGELARIKIAEDEQEFYAESLAKILGLGARMQSMDTEGIVPMFHALELMQPLREDQVTETNERERMLALAPKSMSGLYLVPKVIE